MVRSLADRTFQLRFGVKDKDEAPTLAVAAVEEAGDAEERSLGSDQTQKEERVRWAANKRFEISKFKFKFPRARTYERIRARSRLYRSHILEVNTRWKALAEIYTMHSNEQCIRKC